MEICLNNEWGTVCDRTWDVSSARVVCRQLGYPTNDGNGTPLHLIAVLLTKNLIIICIYAVPLYIAGLN